MSLKGYSKWDLEAELARRKKAEALTRPELKSMDEIRAGLDKFVGSFDLWFTQHVDETDRGPKDYEYYTYESVIKLLYDHNSFFKWLNEKMTGSD